MIQAQVRLIRRADQFVVGDWPLLRNEPVADNRIGTIVAAFDRGTSAVARQTAGLIARAATAGRYRGVSAQD